MQQVDPPPTITGRQDARQKAPAHRHTGRFSQGVIRSRPRPEGDKAAKQQRSQTDSQRAVGLVGDFVKERFQEPLDQTLYSQSEEEGQGEGVVMLTISMQSPEQKSRSQKEPALISDRAIARSITERAFCCQMRGERPLPARVIQHLRAVPGCRAR